MQAVYCNIDGVSITQEKVPCEERLIERDNDYRKAREGYERYFYPEKVIRAG